MTTLPPALREQYDTLIHHQQSQAAWNLIEGFCKEYSVTDTEYELTQLFNGALTSDKLPHTHLPEERHYMLAFYEYTKVLMQAVHKLYKDANGTMATHYSPEKNTPKNILDYIIAFIQPESIYRIPTVNNNDEIDLLIVIPSGSRIPFKNCEAILDMAGMQLKHFTFSLHLSGDLQKQLAEGHLFYSSICIQHNRIYDNGTAVMSPISFNKSADTEAKALLDFTTFYNKAISFMESAKMHDQLGDRETAAFMLHQCMELTLRSVILALMGQETATHSIVNLLKYTRRCAPAINGIFAGNTEIEQQLLKQLEKLYVNTRYEKEYTVSTTELVILFGWATLVLIAAKQVFIQSEYIFP